MKERRREEEKGKKWYKRKRREKERNYCCPTSSQLHCSQDGSLFIRDESPEVDLEVVGVHLHLLEAILTKRPQSHTL